MRKSMILAVVALVVSVSAAQAQLTKTIPGERKTVTATVESIEQSSRQVQVKMQDGTFDVITVPDGMKRFDTLKVGDKITATYYENVVLQLRPPDAKTTNTASAAIKKAPDGKDAVTGSVQRTITATVAAIDEKVPSITFTGPNGWKYSGRVQDKKALAQVKVGDKIDITWTAATIISIADAK
jgi:methionine-rich copper-binding protein CopC